MEDDAAVGRNLAQLRTAKGVSQSELAEKLGVAQQTVAKIEKGTRSLKYLEAVHICFVLGVDVKALVSDDIEGSLGLIAIASDIWSASGTIHDVAPTLANALVQLSYEVAGIKAGVRPPALESEYQQAMNLLRTDWGTIFNRLLDAEVHSNNLISRFADEFDSETGYLEVLGTMVNRLYRDTPGPPAAPNEGRQ